MQSGLESSICKGGDTVVEVGDEESNCFTVTPNISPTSTAIEYTKLPLSERIVVKRHGGDIVEEDIFLYRIKHDKKYGVVNQYGEVVVEPVYEYMDGFCEGYAVVYQDKKYGYITVPKNWVKFYDVDGTTAVALVYKFLQPYTQSSQLDYYIPDRYKEGYGISKAGIYS